MAGENGWHECIIGDLAASQKNALVGGPFGSNLVKRDYVATGVPVIRGQNMGDRWIGGEFAFVSEAKAESLSANVARPGDLVFTQRGTLGQVALVPEKPFDRYIVSQSQMKLTPDEKKADSRFLYYVFTSPAQIDYIKRNAIQTGVPHTNLGILRDTPIRLPPLSEQKAIAEILGALDAKIELNRRMNETLESLARSLFKSWFVDFDPVRRNCEGRSVKSETSDPSPFPLHSSNFDSLFPDSFEHQNGSLIPAGWKIGSIGDVGDNPRRSIKPDEIAPGTPYIALEHMPRRCISLSDWDDADDIASGKCEFHRGEILFGKLRPYFHKVGVPDAQLRAAEVC